VKIMISTNVTEYSDGSYSASLIEYSNLEGNSYQKIMDDLDAGKIRHIGEVHCFDEKGKYRILKNLQSKKFQN